jgi:hypothetical protein
MPIFLKVNTQTMHFTQLYTTAMLHVSLKPYTVAGFEPGSSVPEADAMSTAPRRQYY